MTTKVTDSINHPAHYAENKTFGHECIDFAQYMPFCLGNCFKYVWRAEFKGHPQEDMAKALWYWEREKECPHPISYELRSHIHRMYKNLKASDVREETLLQILRYAVFGLTDRDVNHWLKQYTVCLKTLHRHDFTQTGALLLNDVARRYAEVVDRHPVYPTDSPVHAAAIITEEAGEAIQAANDGSVSRLRDECLDTIVAALRCVEAIDRGEVHS